MEVKVLKDILSANNQIAEQNRRLLASKKIMAVNLMSSPGAGKTTLILRTVEALQGRARIGVIEGDVSSSIDAEKLSQAGVTAIQINTGGGCHLDASMVNSALANLLLDDIDILFIENVGNLICPSGFDLGEHLKVVILSTPEGDDKPHKYPMLFANADALVINKTDLLAHVNFDLDGFKSTFKGVNQRAALFAVSGVSGEGIREWAAWIMEKLASVRSGK
ncbi:MAG TPA: hydrogenase nickel incorporation protein HypB [Dehalococcoidia bacterium]|jgi:hydrogenase nickel incorporation protein HypB|nr:hydrogenase nickel incorporation protein HypB [Dehalococcoidia bacterium]